MDWTAYRDQFEREASAYIGRPVTIAGKADVRLLPTPVLSFTNISIGDGAAPDVEIERFRAEVELAPLLKGEVRIIQMSVERPRFHFDIARLAEAQTAGSGNGWRVDAERISLARLEIIDGSARITDSRGGRGWQAADVDAVVEAGSLRGPARIEAALVLDGTPVTVRAGLGRFDASETMTANITIGSPRYPVTLATDGILSLATGEPPKFNGTATVAGLPPPSEDEPRSPWADLQATGTFELTPSALAVEAAQISYGAMERPLILEGSGRLDFGEAPRFDLTVGARQIDIDQALGGGAERPVAIADGFAALLLTLPNLPKAPLPGVLRLDAQGLVIGGGVIQAVGIDLATQADGWRIDSLAALLPGETRVDLNGMLRTQSGLAFQGHARVASERPAALAAWWRGQSGTAGALDSFSIEADLDLGPDDRRFSGIVAKTEGGAVMGSVDLRTFPQSGQLFLAVDLSAERADLAQSRALGELLVGDALGAGRIDQMTMSLRADVLSASGVEAQSVVVEGGFEAGQMDLRRFSIADLEGASIEARGSIRDPFGAPSGRVDASVAAANVSGAAEFLASVLPDNQAVARLREAAPALSPVEAEISAEAGSAGGPISVELTGSFADTHLTVTATGAGSLGEPENLTGRATLQVDGEDSAKVLSQVGLAPLPIPAGPLRLDATFEGSPASAGVLDLGGTIAGVALTYKAETARRDGEIVMAGDFTAESGDVDPALLLAGFAIPGLGEGHAASASGRLEVAGATLNLSLDAATFDAEPVGGSIQASFGQVTKLAGSLALKTVSLPVLASFTAGAVPGVGAEGWSDAAFSTGVPADVDLNFRLRAEALDLGLAATASDASLQFGLSGGALNIDLANATFAGGALRGAIAGRVNDGEAQLAIRAALQGGNLQALVWERNGLPIASGLMDASFDLTGTGRSMAGLVSTLAGSGSFAVSDGRINALNPEALDAVMQAADGDEEPDEQAARETFAIMFGSGALSFGRAAGSLAVAGGVVSVPTVSMSAQDTTVLADASLDLNTLSLNSEWNIRSNSGVEENAQPSIRIAFSGPIARPERQVDLSPLLDMLRSNYLQRQLAEIEELEEARRQAEARRAAAEREAAAAEAERARQRAPDEAPVPPGGDAVQPGAPPAEPGGNPPPDNLPPLDLLPQQGASDPLARPSLLAPIGFTGGALR